MYETKWLQRKRVIQTVVGNNAPLPADRFTELFKAELTYMTPLCSLINLRDPPV